MDRKCMRHLRTHENDLRRIINPNEHYNNGSSRPVGRFKTLLTNVKPDGQFPELEQKRGQKRPQPDIVPIDGYVGQPLEHHRE